MCAQAISLQHTYEEEDDADEAAEEAAEAQEQRVKDAQQVSNAPEPHDGGIYFSERLAFQAQRLAAKLRGNKAPEQLTEGTKVAAWSARS